MGGDHKATSKGDDRRCSAQMSSYRCSLEELRRPTPQSTENTAAGEIHISQTYGKA